MNVHTTPKSNGYDISVEHLSDRVAIVRDGMLLAESRNAKVMYETRLPPTIYVPRSDVCVDLSGETGLQTFCPFKGNVIYWTDASLKMHCIASKETKAAHQ